MTIINSSISWTCRSCGFPNKEKIQSAENEKCFVCGEDLSSQVGTQIVIETEETLDFD